MADLLKKNELEAHTLLTVKEVREVFGIARSTVYRWIDRCWLRKAGQVQAPEDYKSQKIVLLELADKDLQEQFVAWMRAQHESGRSPRFFVDDLARVDPLPAEDVDPRNDSKRLVGELDNLMGNLDRESEERERLVDELDSVPAIEPSGLKLAKKGLSEIVDLLKEISDREEELREETVELPKELDLPPEAKESEEFARELGEERGTGLEPTGSKAADADGILQDLQKEEWSEFAFLADPETINEEGEWIELNIDELESPLLKEELLALDESFLPSAKRRGIDIDFNKGILSEVELDELSAARESANPSGEDGVVEDKDEQNDSWLGISITAEENGPGNLAEDPYDPTGDWLEGDELHHLHAGAQDEDAEGFYLDGEELKAEVLEVEPESKETHDLRMPEEIGPETGISEAMLTGEDAVELEPDREILEMEEAYEAEAGDRLTEGDQVIPDSEEGSEDEFNEPALLSLEDLEAEALLSLDDLDEELDLAVEIEVEEDELLPLEDVAIQIKEEEHGEDVVVDVEAESFDESDSSAMPLALDGLELDSKDESPKGTPDEYQTQEIATEEQVTEEITEEPELGSPSGSTQDAEKEEDRIPAAAMQESKSEPAMKAAAQVGSPSLDMEVLESSAEMIKEGMIGIRLSILEVKEGLGILQDPVDSVSRNTEKVSEGVLEIANEARETRLALENLAARLENLVISPLRSGAKQDMTSGGTFITGLGLALLVITWCLGLYLRGEGNAMSLYIVFGANLLITFAILMLRSPRAPLHE